MKLITIVGVSGSGKTTVAEALIRAFTAAGLSVASAKSIACGRPGIHRRQAPGLSPHQLTPFTIDTPGSNSYRHRQAGSSLVLTRAATETALLFPQELPLPSLLPLLAPYDYVILEGDYDAPLPRIVTAVDPADAAERVTPRAFAVSGQAASRHRHLCGLPAFDVTTPEGASALASLTAQMATPWPAPATPALSLRDATGHPLPLPESLHQALALALLSANTPLPPGAELTIRLPGEANP